MSETSSNPSPTDSPATPPAEASTHAVPEAVALDAAAPQLATKKKRKRKRKRKSAGSSGENTGAAASETAASGTAAAGTAASGTAAAGTAASGIANAATRSDVGRAIDATRGRASPTHGAKGSRKDHNPRGNRRRPEPMHKSHRRDAERALRTQEQLASWRWVPTGSQLGYFPATVAPPPSESPAAEVAHPPHPSVDDVATDVTATDATATDATATDVTATDATATDVTATDATATDVTATDGAPDANATGAPAAAGVETLGASAAAQSHAGDEPAAEELPVEVEPHANVEAAAPPHTSHGTRPEAASPPRWSIPSDAQFAPWLSEVLALCPDAERPSLIVSLCSHRVFRQRVEHLAQPELRPLVSVYDAVFLDAAPSVATVDAASESTTPGPDAREELRRGLDAVCRGTADILRAWPLAARERLSELAEGFELDNALQADAARLFFDAPKLVGRLGLRAVCDALSQGHDAAARELIKALGSQPGVPGLLPMLTEALDGQRFGSLVILSYGGAQSRGPDPKAPKRHAGFCLESQRDVWIRTGEGPEAAAFEHYSQVHRRALLPGVVGLYSFGVTRSRKPYAAVLRKGISLQRKLGHGWGLPRLAAVGLATELTLLASGLCRAGLRLPDLDARRFELDDDGRVWLSDLWGAELMEARAQDSAAVAVCRDTVVQLLANQPGFTLPADWREVLSHSADFETIVATLRKLEKSRFWRS